MAVSADVVTVRALFVAVVESELVILIITDDARAPRDVALFDVNSERGSADVRNQGVPQRIGCVETVGHVFFEPNRPCIGAGLSGTFGESTEV